MDNDKINIIEKTKKIVDPWEDYINENYDNLTYKKIHLINFSNTFDEISLIWH